MKEICCDLKYAENFRLFSRLWLISTNPQGNGGDWIMDYIRKTARLNGKKYAAYGKTELESMTKLAEKLAAARRG